MGACVELLSIEPTPLPYDDALTVAPCRPHMARMRLPTPQTTSQYYGPALMVLLVRALRCSPHAPRRAGAMPTSLKFKKSVSRRRHTQERMNPTHVHPHPQHSRVVSSTVSFRVYRYSLHQSHIVRLNRAYDLSRDDAVVDRGYAPLANEHCPRENESLGQK